jgi:hypothetical protein
MVQCHIASHQRKPPLCHNRAPSRTTTPLRRQERTSVEGDEEAPGREQSHHQRPAASQSHSMSNLSDACPAAEIECRNLQQVIGREAPSPATIRLIKPIPIPVSNSTYAWLTTRTKSRLCRKLGRPPLPSTAECLTGQNPVSNSTMPGQQTHVPTASKRNRVETNATLNGHLAQRPNPVSTHTMLGQQPLSSADCVVKKPGQKPHHSH